MKFFSFLLLVIISLSCSAQWNELTVGVNDEWQEVEVFESDVIYLLAISKVAKSVDGGLNWSFYSPTHQGYFTAMSFVDKKKRCNNTRLL